jgi:hypothetical protein
MNGNMDFVGRLEGKNQEKGLAVHGRVRLKCILEKQNRLVRTGSIRLRIGTSGEFLRTR